MTLVLYAFAYGLLLLFAALVHQRRSEAAALTAAECAVRILPETTKGRS